MQTTPSEDTGPLRLDPVLDLKAAGALHTALLSRRGQDLLVDVSEVRRLGGQCLQILLAATKAWAADGRTLSFEAPSEAFIQSLHQFGVHSDNGFESLRKELAV
jgi:chemotaxis protein CheX